MAKKEEAAVGVPFYIGGNPYQSGAISPKAIFGNPMATPIQQKIYRDIPAPFNCVYCGNSGVTEVRSKPSLAAVIGFMMPTMLDLLLLPFNGLPLA